MTTSPKNEAVEMLKDELKALQANCVNACHVIENSPADEPCMNQEDTNAKSNNYIKGLATEVQNSNTRICTNEDIILVQFLNDMKEKMTHLDELSSYTEACIKENDAEINKLKTQIATAKEAMSKPKTKIQQVNAEHIEKAKDTFVTLKGEVHGLIHSLFPDCKDKMLAMLGDFIQSKQKEPSSYLEVTSENQDLVKMLEDINIVAANPYNNIIMTYINITSVKLFVKVQNIFGVCKVFACLIVIGGGIYEIARGNTDNLNKGFEGSTTSPGGIALALYSGLWAYDGWNSVTVVTEEIINPAVNVPLSISIAVPLITALYVFMNVAYMTVLSYAEMVSVPAVAVAFGTRVLGPASFLVPLGVAIATFGCAMSVQFGVTRVCYTAARGGHMLEVFSYVNVLRLTPAPAVAFQCLLTTMFISVGNIQTLIEFASWFLWFFYGLAMVALLVLRKTQAAKPRPYRVPTLVPCFVLLVAIFLSVLPIVHDPSLKYLMAIGFIVIGVAVYTTFVYYKKTPTYLLSKFTFLTQVLFQSVPPSKYED